MRHAQMPGGNLLECRYFAPQNELLALQNPFYRFKKLTADCRVLAIEVKHGHRRFFSLACLVRSLSRNLHLLHILMLSVG